MIMTIIGSNMKGLMLRMTYWIWRPYVSKRINLAYQRGFINSEQMHVLSAMFDRSQVTSFVLEASERKKPVGWWLYP